MPKKNKNPTLRMWGKSDSESDSEECKSESGYELKESESEMRKKRE